LVKVNHQLGLVNHIFSNMTKVEKHAFSSPENSQHGKSWGYVAIIFSHV